MAEVVLVHGIDQQQKSADKLENEWLPALAGGIRVSGFPEVADQLWRQIGRPGSIEARMAFYGHLFLTSGQQGDDPGDFTLEQAELAEDLAREWLVRAAERATKEGVRETGARELDYLTREMGTEQGVGAVIRSAISSIAKIPWFAPFGMAFAERFVLRALAQVTQYFTNEEIRSAALKSALNLIGADTKVLIGHSLGSVLAYEAAHLLEQPLPLLVTIGSPLGLQSVVYQRLRPQPPTFPSKVQRWVNIADLDDFVAAEPNLEKLFGGDIPQSATFEGGHTIDNGAEPHRADFYLGKAQVGGPVGKILCR